MSEENKNQITYDEDWQSVSRSEYPARVNEFEADTYGDDNTESKNKISKKKKDSPKQYLITIQLVLCILIALAAFVLKSIGSDVYSNVRDWYYSQLNSSVIFDSGTDNDGYSLNSLFGGSTQDEA